MTELLNDLSNKQAVIRAIEENMLSFWMGYGRLPRREAFEDERLMYFSTGLPHPLFNAVFNTRLTSSQIELTIAEVVAHYSARKLPAFWWVGASTLPSDLGEHLKKQGFHGGGYTPGMAVELAALPESVPVPDDFQIEVVDNEVALREWVEVVAISNEMHPATFQPLYELELSRGVETMRRYLGKSGEKPVAGSALHIDAGVGGLYAVATLPEVRGKGIGAAISLQPMLDGRAMGYQVGVLQSSPMGYKVYKRLGFKDYSQLEIYYLQPKS